MKHTHTVLVLFNAISSGMPLIDLQEYSDNIHVGLYSLCIIIRVLIFFQNNHFCICFGHVYNNLQIVHTHNYTNVCDLDLVSQWTEPDKWEHKCWKMWVWTGMLEAVAVNWNVRKCGCVDVNWNVGKCRWVFVNKNRMLILFLLQCQMHRGKQL